MAANRCVLSHMTQQIPESFVKPKFAQNPVIIDFCCSLLSLPQVAVGQGCQSSGRRLDQDTTTSLGCEEWPCWCCRTATQRQGILDIRGVIWEVYLDGNLPRLHSLHFKYPSTSPVKSFFFKGMTLCYDFFEYPCHLSPPASGKANPNSADEQGHVAINDAVAKDRFDLVTKLLEYGALVPWRTMILT